MVVADETMENTCGVTVLGVLLTLACVRIWQFFGFNWMIKLTLSYKSNYEGKQIKF